MAHRTDFSKVRKAVIPAAGWGTRFLPATKASPKEMLPVVDKPTIQYVVEEAANSGLYDILIVTGRTKRAIEDHFDRSTELEAVLSAKGRADQLALVEQISRIAELHFVRQKEQLGLGHAVLCAKHHVGDQPFAVLLGDDIIDSVEPVTAQLLALARKEGCGVVALERHAGPEISRYGVVSGSPLREGIFTIDGLVEKPPADKAPSQLAVMGRYVLPPTVFPLLEKTAPGVGGEIQITDALDRLAKEDRLLGLEYEGHRYDIGDKHGWMVANIELMLKHPTLGPPLRDYLSSRRPTH